MCVCTEIAEMCVHDRDLERSKSRHTAFDNAQWEKCRIAIQAHLRVCASKEKKKTMKTSNSLMCTGVRNTNSMCECVYECAHRTEVF